MRRRRDRPRQWRTEHQCPADHLPPTHLPGEDRSLRVSDCGCDDRQDQQRVGGVQRATAFVDDVRNDCREADRTASPVGRRRALSGQRDASPAVARGSSPLTTEPCRLSVRRRA